MIALYIVGGLFGLILLFLLFCYFASLFIKKDADYAKDSRFYRGMLELWIPMGLFFCGVKLHTKGLEKLPEGRFMLVSNHISNFDPLVTWLGIPKRNLAFVSKESNLKIPFFGPLAYRCGTLSLDREDPRKAMRTLMTAADRIKADSFSYGIYPEGTRNKGEDALLPFHAGSFKMAQMAEVPIVVMATKHTEDVKKNWPRRTDIELQVLDVIPASEVLSKKTVELSEYAETIIRSFLES